MSRPLRLLIQDEMFRGVRPPAPQAEVISFSGHDPDRLRILMGINEAALGTRTICFVSLQVASLIRRGMPNLAAGLFLDEELLRAHRVLGHFGPDVMLGRDAIFMPLGTIPGRLRMIRALYGERIFIRPDSSMKSFAGFCCAIDELAFEVSARKQTCAVRDDELVMICRAREISPHEYRLWIADARVLTHSHYAHETTTECPPCPAEIIAFAGRLAPKLEGWCNPVVADFVMDETGRPKLIELNGLSTSGLYQHVDLDMLAEGIGPILL